MNDDRVVTIELTVEQISTLSDALFGFPPCREVANSIQSVLWAARWSDETLADVVVGPDESGTDDDGDPPGQGLDRDELADGGRDPSRVDP